MLPAQPGQLRSSRPGIEREEHEGARLRIGVLRLLEEFPGFGGRPAVEARRPGRVFRQTPPFQILRRVGHQQPFFDRSVQRSMQDRVVDRHGGRRVCEAAQIGFEVRIAERVQRDRAERGVGDVARSPNSTELPSVRSQHGGFTRTANQPQPIQHGERAFGRSSPLPQPGLRSSWLRSTGGLADSGLRLIQYVERGHMKPVQ